MAHRNSDSLFDYSSYVETGEMGDCVGGVSKDTHDGGGRQGCQMEKFETFLSFDCARVEGHNPRKGRNLFLTFNCARVEGRDAIQGKEGIKFCSIS